MNVNRRIFLKQGALAFVCLGAGPMWGPNFLRQTAFAADLGSQRDDKILICIFQRGAVDGLSMVVPYGDPHYYQNRPDISLPAPAQAAGADGVLDLDGYFGFNPALAPLLPIFKQGQLAAIQACGSPNSSRSHFESQDLMESGVDEGNGVRDGWLNRLLGCCPEDAAKHSAFRAVSTTAITPRSLQGEQDSLAIRDLDTFGLAGDNSVMLPGPSGTANGFESMYASAVDTVLHGTARESFDALGMLDKIRSGKYVPANGAAYPQTPFGKNLRQIAQLIKANVGVQVAFAEVDGWDTHANQGNAKGVLSTRLGQFGQSLAALHQDLGDRMSDVVVVTMSEFGRTVHENGNRGTDHGHGTCFFAMGGPIKGGKVYGDWPTLAPDKLFQNRDLAVTTDFREVFGEIVSRHFGVPMADMPALFPNYAVDAARFRNFYAA
ncbi:MAG TPA: DUF1501 domain-containing protein [Candidatus Methylacidiphilales bacterium]|jgi:uncharacterized protein (DUF1501 family)|nr:DUF1501 domain-containing protein [Candidatus Methylacidiphilales bacterium]